MYPWLASHFACLCPPSDGVKGMCHHTQPLTCFELWVPNTSFSGGLQTLGFMGRVTETEWKIPKP